VTYQVGLADDVRSAFINGGQLKDSIDTRYRSISDRTPVFAFSHWIDNVSKYNSSQEYLLTQFLADI
jgi:Domain of unknown function (DUF5127)